MREVTLLLQRLGAGERTAAEELLPLVYDRLHELARGYMFDERREHTLQPTALIHEAWLRLEHEPDSWLSAPTGTDRNVFFGIAARAMRRILVEHARRRSATKREGNAQRVPLDEVLDNLEKPARNLVALDQALEQLAARDPELSRLVELRFFGGLTVQQVADVLNISHRRVERGWTTARLWLKRALVL